MDFDTLTQVLTMPVKRSLSDEVALRLREAIVTGGFPQGERLREEDLATTLKVSRGPIREALNKLEREGLVVISPNRGATVTMITRKDLDEIFSLRLSLEQLAAVEAMKYDNQASLAEMQTCVVEMGEAVTHVATAARDAAELDVRFHELLVQSANHTRLYRHWMELRPQIQWLLLARTLNPDFKDYAVSGHQNILDAIRQKNKSAVLDILAHHMSVAYERVASVYIK
ncbi:MAG: GntR family transcriptional regulator [Anaerolineae bacterium]|nr:GntR family transcriptional regulator [Anaerolineae bacterium]